MSGLFLWSSKKSHLKQKNYFYNKNNAYLSSMMLSEEYIQQENKEIAQQYKDLLRVSYRHLDDNDKKLIRKAFDLAIDAHNGQRRKSGEAYIFHPIAVAKIVADEIGLDATSIAAALLHDVVEDTKYTLKDIEKNFGVTIMRIVDGLTKISNIDLEQDVSLQAENFRKMLLTLNEDVRVILIKLADRLHNMRTMDSMPPYKRLQKSSETLYIYAPLAHRIGLYNTKTELEDLGLKYTEPEIYQDIETRLIETKEERNTYIKTFSSIISTALNAENIDYYIKGRTKSIYSIRKKILAQSISFDEIYDKFAIRIIYKSDPSTEKFLAWKIYSIVTDNFRPNPTRLRDWISSPKSTGYEALHITVMGPKGRWVEVQIRSERMHDIAERGYAAHYKYKHQDDKNKDDNLDDWLNRLREALENQETNAVDFVEQFKLNLYAKEIFVFTPQGDLKSLPKGSTPLDFAFSIHTEIGLHTRGAKVNGKLVPLSRTLKSGDQVEIITTEQVKPTIKWLDYANTGRARSKIKTALKAEKKEQADLGKEILRRKLRAQKIPFNDKTIQGLIRFFNLQTSLDLYYRVKIGTIDNIALKKYAATRSNALMSLFKTRIRKPTQAVSQHAEEITTNYDQLVFGENEEQLNYTLANCCNPIPGDDVFGFLTVNKGIKVHKSNCPNAIQLQSNYAYRIIRAKWIDSSQEEFRVVLKLSGLDNLGLLSDITREISKNLHVNMQSVSFESQGNMFEGKIALRVNNNTILKKLIKRLKEIDGIDKVTRE